MKRFFTSIQATVIKLTGGSPGIGKVLTSDADGNGSWETPSGGGSGGYTQYLYDSAATQAGNVYNDFWDLQDVIKDSDSEQGIIRIVFIDAPPAIHNMADLNFDNQEWVGNGDPAFYGTGIEIEFTGTSTITSWIGGKVRDGITITANTSQPLFQLTGSDEHVYSFKVENVLLKTPSDNFDAVMFGINSETYNLYLDNGCMIDATNGGFADVVGGGLYLFMDKGQAPIMNTGTEITGDIDSTLILIAQTSAVSPGWNIEQTLFLGNINYIKSGKAADTTYNNSDSGLEASEVNAAIDELAATRPPITVDSTAPSSPEVGDLWVDTT